MIDRQFAESHLTFVHQILSSSNQRAFEDDSDHITVDEKLFKKSCQTITIEAGVVKASRWRSFSDAPDDSVAVIDINGPIMKYGGDCGEPGAVHFERFIKEANASGRIVGILLNIDSPGGMVDGTQSVVNAIKNSQKPVVSIVSDGMMASAAVWIGSAANEVYASMKTDTIGSIGVYSTIYDFKGWFEQNGIKIHEIYAPQSKDKNRDYKEALKGNYSLIQAELKLIADEFISSVKENRNGKISFENENPFTGKMYPADQAKAIGLIDGIISFDEAVNRVYQLAGKDKSKTILTV